MSRHCFVTSLCFVTLSVSVSYLSPFLTYCFELVERLLIKLHLMRSSSPPLQISRQMRIQAHPALRRAMSYTSTPNSSGLVPQHSKALPDRPVRPEEERIISSIKDLYSCKPRENTYEVYSEDAVFKDPVGIAEGVASIETLFNGLAKIFPRAEIPKIRVLQNPDGLPQSTILIDQEVAYYRDPNSSTPTKTLNSLLTISTNDEYKITRHVEEWDHQYDVNKDGFFSMLDNHRKKVTASLVIDGHRLVADGPSLVADGPSLVEDGLNLVADGPNLVADGPSLEVDGPSLEVDGSSLEVDGSSLEVDGPVSSSPPKDEETYRN